MVTLAEHVKRGADRATRRRARLEGGSLRVLRASPRVLRIIALTRLQQVLMPAARPESAAS